MVTTSHKRIRRNAHQSELSDLEDVKSTKAEKNKSSSVSFKSRQSKKNKRKQKKNKKEQLNAESTRACPSSQVDNMEIHDTVDMSKWMTVGIDMHPTLLVRLRDMGFTSPTPIQRAMLPKVMVSLKDVIAAAETGSGKTLSYGLPILDSLIRLQDTDGGKEGRRRRRYVI